MGRVLEAAPGLCGCEECTNNDGVPQSPRTINASWQCQEESSQVQEGRQKRESSQTVRSQQQESSPEASQREDQGSGANQEDGKYEESTERLAVVRLRGQWEEIY